MQNGIHFISGLPRSGSTLLAAILRQNPRIHAAMSSPVGGLFRRLQGGMSPQAEFASFITPEQRQDILRGLFESYYKDVHPRQVVVDTNRLWCSRMGAIAQLFPAARVIVCVRELLWVMDSFERILRRTPLMMSRMFRPQDAVTVYTRINALAAGTGTVGFAWNAVQEAFYGEHADRLLVIDYEALTREPARVLNFIYEALELHPFEHDFENVTYEAGEGFDSQLGVPGLHKVSGKVSFTERTTILPPDLVERFSGRSFWRRPRANTRNVAVLLPSEQRPRTAPQGGFRPPIGGPRPPMPPAGV